MQHSCSGRVHACLCVLVFLRKHSSDRRRIGFEEVRGTDRARIRIPETRDSSRVPIMILYIARARVLHDVFPSLLLSISNV